MPMPMPMPMLAKVDVARRYKFRGRHHVPGLPVPWCEPHDHSYTVEVVARGAVDCEIVIDTDKLDDAWRGMFGVHPNDEIIDLSERYQPENTTVEHLARWWLEMFSSIFNEVYRVVVWEDDTRWGSAEITPPG